MPACDLQPAGTDAAINHLAANLRLVAPVNMSEAERTEWLMVAATDLAKFPADLLADACAAARLVCQFPGQIVPAVAKEASERLALRSRTIEARQPLPKSHRIEHHGWKPEPGELDRIKREVAEGLGT
tara:strand:+ start:20599 stop:20982 length:384 start_codon:yes stop_codon:yes gene_type:complete